MINKTQKKINKERRVSRARFKLKKNGQRPRLVFNKSNRYLIAQVIDDVAGKTLAYASTQEPNFPSHENSKKSKSAAQVLGKVIAERAKKAGVSLVMLDRSGMIYHGAIASFADAAREGGLEF
jgi:large subunit ribosomal protein L18